MIPATADARWLSAWQTTPIERARRETGTRHHRAPVGLIARAFRQGFKRGGRDALRRAWALLPTDQRSLVAQLANEYAEELDVNA